MKYGKLKIIKEVEKHTYPSGRKQRKVLCLCECGIEKEFLLKRLKSGHTKSCGCLQKEIARKNCYKHGLHKHRIYGVWRSMVDRCVNKKNRSYKDYGGRGISVCKKWLDVKAFINDMYGTFEEGLTLDRIDNNGNYCKENCRRATQKEQAINRRDNRKYLGKTVSQRAEELSINRKSVYTRIGRGSSVKEALFGRECTQ